MTPAVERAHACRRLIETALLLAATSALSCASRAPVVEQTRRQEERIERAPAPPPVRAAVPAPVLPPAEIRVRPASLTSPPLSALARTGGSGSAARLVEYVLDDLRFAPGAPALDARTRRALDELAARLRAAPPGWVIEIQGHADATGPELENLRLGLARAEAVRDYLVRAGGIPRDRTAVVSLGSSQPAGDNSTAEGRSRNRRAVVLVLR